MHCLWEWMYFIIRHFLHRAGLNRAGNATNTSWFPFCSIFSRLNDARQLPPWRKENRAMRVAKRLGENQQIYICTEGRKISPGIRVLHSEEEKGTVQKWTTIELRNDQNQGQRTAHSVWQDKRSKLQQKWTEIRWKEALVRESSVGLQGAVTRCSRDLSYFRM